MKIYYLTPLVEKNIIYDLQFEAIRLALKRHKPEKLLKMFCFNCLRLSRFSVKYDKKTTFEFREKYWDKGRVILQFICSNCGRVFKVGIRRQLK